MLFYPTYFPTIFQYAKMIQTDSLVFEIEDNFQKQTYRNRCYIYGANGKQLLNVPIQKISGKQKTKEVRIDYNENWQKQHLKSLLSAYKSSPFFEFYIDDIAFVFNKKETHLIDLNINTFTLINSLLPISIDFSIADIFEKNVENDFRSLVNSKNKENLNLSRYTQVFSNKLGFIENLSILDLLFSEGPNAIHYLEKIT